MAESVESIETNLGRYYSEQFVANARRTSTRLGLLAGGVMGLAAGIAFRWWISALLVVGLVSVWAAGLLDRVLTDRNDASRPRALGAERPGEAGPGHGTSRLAPHAADSHAGEERD